MPKLEVLINPPKEKSSGGFFGFGGGGKKTVADDMVATCLLSYGYVTAYADVALMLSRLDVHVIPNLMPVLNNPKSLIIRVNVIKAVDLIGKALHQSRLPDEKKNFKVAQRDNLLSGILKIFQAGSKANNELVLLGLNAASTLANLEVHISYWPTPNKTNTENNLPTDQPTKKTSSKKENIDQPINQQNKQTYKQSNNQLTN